MEPKKAIVTGASRGIGHGIAMSLAAAGYDLAVSYASKKDEAERLAQRVGDEHGRQCHIFGARLEEKGAGVDLFHRATRALGGLDLLVNNAGITVFESILDLSEDSLDRLLALDFKNYLLMAREAGRYMAKRGTRGSIINITSSRGERAYPEDAVYGGIKAGLNRAVQSIALDLAPYGIRANNVAPGAIRVRSEEELQADDSINAEPGFWDGLGGVIPLERSGLPRDIGEAVVFLASDKADYITGVTLRVDGGLILPGMPEHVENPTGWGAQKRPQPGQDNGQPLRH